MVYGIECSAERSNRIGAVTFPATSVMLEYRYVNFKKGKFQLSETSYMQTDT